MFVEQEPVSNNGPLLKSKKPNFFSVTLFCTFICSDTFSAVFTGKDAFLTTLISDEVLTGDFLTLDFLTLSFLIVAFLTMS